MLPLGLKDEVGYDTVKVFCPKCQSVYHPPLSRRGGTGAIDGASFGTTFAHLFLMTFSNLVPDPLSPDSVYVPRIFGFRVYPSAKQRPSSGNAQLSLTAGSNPTNARNGRVNGHVAAAASGTTPSANATAAAWDAKKTSAKGSQPQQNDQIVPFEDNTPTIPAASVQGQAVKAAGGSDSLDISGKNDTTAGNFEANEEAASADKFDDEVSKELSQRQDGSDDNPGKFSQGQPKRRSRNNNFASPPQVEENGNSGDLSSMKQSKRQKRQSSAVGT